VDVTSANAVSPETQDAGSSIGPVDPPPRAGPRGSTPRAHPDGEQVGFLPRYDHAHYRACAERVVAILPNLDRLSVSSSNGDSVATSLRHQLAALLPIT